MNILYYMINRGTHTTMNSIIPFLPNRIDEAAPSTFKDSGQERLTLNNILCPSDFSIPVPNSLSKTTFLQDRLPNSPREVTTKKNMFPKFLCRPTKNTDICFSNTPFTQLIHDRQTIK